MKVEEFSDTELQLMRLAVPRPEMLSKFFEGEEDKNRYYIQNVTKPPVTFVKELSLEDLAAIILKYGYRRSADSLSVSESFLRSWILSRCSSEIHLKFNSTILDPVDEEIGREYIERIPYLRLLKAVTFWSEKKIKKIIKKEKISGLCDRLTTTKGRVAELFYKEIRGSSIIKDCNEIKVNSPFDFLDAEYKRVNVKAVSLKETKTKGDCWYFTLGKECDYYALVGYDKTFEFIEFVIMLQNDGAKTYRILRDGILDFKKDILYLK